MTGASMMPPDLTPGSLPLPAQRQQLAYLFMTLTYGERLAQACAVRQAMLVSNHHARRFLEIQSRQEGLHATLFEQVHRWLAPRQAIREPTALRRFGHRLEQALARNDLVASLLGGQIVLEGLGSQILQQLDQGMDNSGLGCKRLRRLIIRQEQSHHAFGDRLLRDTLIDAAVSPQQAWVLAQDYLQLADELLDEMADVFAVLDEPLDSYRQQLHTSLPAWLRHG